MNNPFTFELEESEFEAMETGGFETPEEYPESGPPEREATEEEVQYSIVISPTSPGDGRVRVPAVNNSNLSSLKFPFNSICLVEAWRNGKWVPWASGNLIAPQVVITAAHVLKANGGLEPKLRFTPGADFSASSSSNKTPAAPKQMEVTSARMKVHSSLDYGVAILPQKFTKPGMFVSLKASLVCKANDYMNVAGYPGDKPSGTMWFHAEPVLVSGISATHLRYTMDTCPGHSGSPVWVKLPDGTRIQVGVHTSGASGAGQKGRCNPPQAVPGQNSGVRVTAQLIQQVNAWCAQFGVQKPRVI
ncbi:MAG TPA: trypsin-like serine protease [Paludibaculum sp.]|jgi:V8-like Glu-specific endopeptidase